jgi:hypothetical protein
MINYYVRIILTYNTTPFLLQTKWSFPRTVNESAWVILKLWAIFFNIKSFFIVFLEKRNWRIYSKILMKKPAAR